MLDEIEDREGINPFRPKHMKDVKKSRGKELLKGAKSMAALVNERLYNDPDWGLDRGEEREEDRQEKGEEEENRDGAKGKGGAFEGVEWSEATLGRFPRPKKGPELPRQTSLRGLNIPFHPLYDDYLNGPTMEALLTLPPELMGYDPSLVYIAKRILVSPWCDFGDVGYRLVPSSYQNFDLGRPVMFKEHLCPVGLADPPSPIFHSENADSVIMGAEELLVLADEKGENVLLTGKTSDLGYDQYIVLDLQRDKVEPSEIAYSCDIDSIIWITQSPKFYGPVGVHASPMIRNKAPIWKSNHVRVELLFPQSEEDREASGPRTEWWTKPWSLSNIPHLNFGTVSPSTPSADILLFFPRMCHREPHRHFWVNQIPSHIQNILWDRVIIPALLSMLGPTEAVYIPVDRGHWHLKRRLAKKSNFVVQYPIPGDRMNEFKDQMKRLVSKTLF
jgi:hypothetical protein